ncbi:AMP binding protein [Mycena pura]|uniref:AMP binding protein n=1 Tax=Mycena pura TaxID=153505 RepID=A0AAD6Y8M4_9AGAR|nr:AMP binding protein [Mycena pura]
MSPRIYTSPYPDIPLPRTSVFTHIFASRRPGDVGGFPGARKAFIDAASGAYITRAQLLDLALAFAHGLRTHPDTRASRGDTVLIFSPNSLAWPVVLFGSVAAGLRCTTANSAYTSRELAHQYVDSRARLLITSEDGLGAVRAMFAELGVPRSEGDRRTIVMRRDLQWARGPAAESNPEAAGLLTMEDLLKGGKMRQEEQFAGDLSNETVFLCYSSGTTGKPKTTHLNTISLLSIVAPCFPIMGPEDIMISILPFYHIYALTQVLQLPLLYGLPVVIQSRFEPTEFCVNIEKYHATFSLIVPPVLVVLARHPAAGTHDLSTLRWLCSGAAPLGKDLVQQTSFAVLFRDMTSTLRPAGYGLTETSPTTHLLHSADAARKMGSIGPLLPNLEARLVDDAGGTAVEAEEGSPGELWIRGPSVMKGYLNNPTATTAAITPDGWFKTGDIAIRDREGYYYIVDRQKELIKYKLESVLLTHPDIADAAVIGVEDAAQATELPRAYVVHSNPDKIRTAAAKAAFADSVVKWMETKVARHKFLRAGKCILPAAGKILRRELRDLAKREAAASPPKIVSKL